MADIPRNRGSRPALAALALLLALPVHAQNFSCRIGTRPACLDYGDKICSGLGKCVDNSSACFDQYQCNYEGFTCKSNVTQCVEEHDALIGKYNTLAADYDALLTKAKNVAKSYDGLNDCLGYARTMDEVRDCMTYQ